MEEEEDEEEEEEEEKEEPEEEARFDYINGGWQELPRPFSRFPQPLHPHVGSRISINGGVAIGS